MKTKHGGDNKSRVAKREGIRATCIFFIILVIEEISGDSNKKTKNKSDNCEKDKYLHEFCLGGETKTWFVGEGCFGGFIEFIEKEG